MKFCYKNSCDNILTISIEDNNLIYKCNICGEKYESTSKDTLVIDEFIKENNTIYKHQTYINNAYNDDIAELVEKKCNNCNNTILKVIKIDPNGRVLYVCSICKKFS